MGYPSGPHFWRQHGCIWTLLLSYFVTLLEARWRVRSFAALWISAAPGLVPAHGVQSHDTLIKILPYIPYMFLIRSGNS